MPRDKKITVGLLIVLAFYAALTMWRFTVSPFPGHMDGTWYDMVARNVAQGRGLTEDCVWYFHIPFPSLSHPIGNFFNPLGPIIVGAFYSIFGISDAVGRLPVFLMDGFLCGIIFMFAFHRFRSLSIATFSSLIFAAHQTILGTRAGGGMPENFLLFFVTLCTCCLIWAWEGKRIHYLTAAACGAIGYLCRNEGGMSLPTIVGLFLYQEVYRPWRSLGTKPSRGTILLLAGVVLLFMAIAFPWEARNHALYGDLANRAKFNYFVLRSYDDIWSYSKTFSLSQFLAMGPKHVLSVLLTSYFYKMETFVSSTTWPLLMFLPLGFLSIRDKTWRIPVVVYFLVSYIVMGALNTIGQNSGWNGIYAYLPFLIPIAISGVYTFAQLACAQKTHATRLAFGICTAIFLFHLADNVRYHHRQTKAGGNVNANTIYVINDWFERSKTKPPAAVMIHYPYLYTYYSGIPTVMIPMNDPIQSVWEVAKKYQPTHLILVGDNDPIFHDLYMGTTTDPHLEPVATIPYRVSLGYGGDRILIFRIRQELL